MFEILRFIQDQLIYFLGCFNSPSYQIFVLIVMGMLMKRDHYGVTSLVRGLEINPKHYCSLLDFFHNRLIDLNRIRLSWYRCLADHKQVYTTNGKVELIGDGTTKKHQLGNIPGVYKQYKYGDKMVQVSYFFGMFWGAVGVVCASSGGFYCIPAFLSIQQGLKSLKLWFDTISPERVEYVEQHTKSHIEQIMDGAAEVAKGMGRPCIVSLDRYFLSTPLLKRMDVANASQRIIDVVARVQNPCSAYELPPAREPHQRGAPRKKGKKVEIFKLFDQKDLFSEAKVFLYGKEEVVKRHAVKLLWHKHLIQFVLVIRQDGSKSVFASTDLELSPEQIIEVYSRRFKIELGFRSLKQVMAAFSGRFWSKDLPKPNRFKKKDEPDSLAQVTDPKQRELILDTIEAHERFATMAAIAMGIAQMIAANPVFAKTIKKHRWLRTPHKGDTVSEETVVYYLSSRISTILRFAPYINAIAIIRDHQEPLDLPQKGSRGGSKAA